jgi:integrase
MTVLLGTGMRVAECTGITKSDINLSENTISVNHNLIYRVIDGKAGFHITTPKTESGTRIIPILYPEVAEQLRLQIETIDALYPDDQLVLGGAHGFVFRNRTGSFMSAHNINRAIERISVTYNMEEMDQAELEDREPDLLPHFSVHNLRHTFCTRLCESTNDVKFIQQVMGHADFSTTMDIYTHITQENMQEKAKNISVNMKLM